MVPFLMLPLLSSFCSNPKVLGRKLGEIVKWTKGNYQEFGEGSFPIFFPPPQILDRLLWRKRYVSWLLFPLLPLLFTTIIPILPNLCSLHLLYDEGSMYDGSSVAF